MGISKRKLRYDYDIIYRKGENNTVADYLSRMPNPEEQPTEAEKQIHKIVSRAQINKIEDLSLTEQSLKHMRLDTQKCSYYDPPSWS